MKWPYYAGAAVFIVLLQTVAAFAQSGSSTELDLGVRAYKQAKFEEAIWHFQNAVSLDSSNVKAHLYLATCYAQQYIPGADTPDNNRLAQNAIAQYKQVMDLHATADESLSAIKGLAYLYLQMKLFDEARNYYRQITELDSANPEPYYSIGVIDWTQTYQPRQEARAKLNLDPDASLPAKSKAVCAEIRDKNWATVADGIENLEKALQLRPDYDDAMAYMNLMYRERADIQCGDPKARLYDLKTADEWVDKTMATKKMKAEKETQYSRKPD